MARKRPAFRPPPPDFDGAILSSWKVEGDQLVRKQEQPTRNMIMDRSAELRKNPDALRRDLPLLTERRLVIPDLDLQALWKKYPALRSTDRHERQEAWLRFYASSEADPYRVGKERSRARKA